jgi:hypothetical protein
MEWMRDAVVISKYSEQYVSVSFPYRADYVDRIRSVPGRRWNPGGKTWLIPYTLANVAALTSLFRGAAELAGELEEECGFVREWEAEET